jgi:Lar family restriction alleviation protein
MSIAFLPCPFCASPRATLYGGPLQPQYYAVMCEDCRAWGPTHKTEGEAVAAWNARRVVAEVEP